MDTIFITVFLAVKNKQTNSMYMCVYYIYTVLYIYKYIYIEREFLDTVEVPS